MSKKSDRAHIAFRNYDWNMKIKSFIWLTRTSFILFLFINDHDAMNDRNDWFLFFFLRMLNANRALCSNRTLYYQILKQRRQKSQIARTCVHRKRFACWWRQSVWSRNHFLFNNKTILLQQFVFCFWRRSTSRMTFWLR